ncbi:MAG: universal stress protein [Burkholderiaceae bacterium]|jgi:nucleotide-binding universal stress UspA family protein|nr:universal stress protein [Burkholderiaceae bacterium]
MQVLVAIDASEASGKMVEYLLRHAPLFQAAQMTCVYIDPPSPLRAVGAFGADPGMPAVAPGDPQAVIAPVLARLRAAGFTPALLLREGEPGPEIAQIAADGGFDLIVMGAGQRGLIRRKLLGSVAHTVLNQATVPVLIVR